MVLEVGMVVVGVVLLLLGVTGRGIECRFG